MYTCRLNANLEKYTKKKSRNVRLRWWMGAVAKGISFSFFSLSVRSTTFLAFDFKLDTLSCWNPIWDQYIDVSKRDSFAIAFVILVWISCWNIGAEEIE